MPDIFGRERHDYKHVRRMDKMGEGVWDGAVKRRALDLGQPDERHDFDGLGSGERRGYSEQGFEKRSESFGFLTDNLLAIQSFVEEVLFTGPRYDEMVPMADGVGEGPTSYTPLIVKRSGRGRFSANDGTDAPVATIDANVDPQKLYLGEIDAQWTLEDLRNAAFGNIPLQTKTLEAAIEGAREHMDVVLLGAGDAERGVRGLSALDNANDGVTVNAGSAFQYSTDAQNRAVINQIAGEIDALIADSQEVVGRHITNMLCIYLPVTQYNAIHRPIGSDFDTSIASALMANNAFTARTGNPIMFKSLIELDQATDRMITTIFDNRVFEFAGAIMPRVAKILDMGRVMRAQIEYKISALYVKRPDLIRIRTGI